MMNRYVGLDVESTAYTILRTCGPRRVVIAQEADGWLAQLAVALREAGVEVGFAGGKSLKGAGIVVRIHAPEEGFEWAKELEPGTSAFVIQACEGERTRRWWEERIFASGLVRHARYLVGSPFSGLRSEQPHGVFVLERPRVQARGGFLAESSDLGDHVFARYMEASEWVRAGDIVLDVASGEGAGSCVLAFNSETGGVIGCERGSVEDSLSRYGSELVHFIGTNEGEGGGAISASTAQMPDGSVDFVVMVRGEMMEQEELMRVLTPGGRVVAFSDWPKEKWAGQRGLLVEHEGPKNGHGEFRTVVLMRTPLGAGKEGYREQMFPDTSHVPGYNLYNFQRDYDNPYLFRAMVCIGPRMSDVGQLKAMAGEVLKGCREGSADQGAAVCVLAYDVLSQMRRVGGEGVQELEGVLARIDAFEKRADGTPHALRWVISNRYVKGRLLLASGRVDEAQRALRACAESDVMPFSPLLATKTVDAWRLAGAIASAKGDVEEARACWLHGMREARRVTSGDWTNVWGVPEEPAPYGLHELSLVMDAASGCASWMNASTRLGAVPGMAWTLAQRQTFGDTRQYIKDLTRGRAWLSAKLEEAQAERARVVGNFEDLRAFHEKQMRAFEGEIKGLQGMIDALKMQVASLEEARAFDHTQGQALERELEAQRRLLQSHREQLEQAQREKIEVAERDQRLVRELQSAIVEYEAGKKWLEGQVESWKSQSETHEKQVAVMRAHQEELLKASAWHAEQMESWKSQCDVREQQIQELREYQRELLKASAWHEEKARVWEGETKEREKSNEALRGQVEAMRKEMDALAVQREGLAKEHQRVVREREECARERLELQRVIEEVKAERVSMVQRAGELEKSLEEARGALERERARVHALKSRSLWERVKNRELEE